MAITMPLPISASVGYQRAAYGRQVHSGERNDIHFLHVEYTAPAKVTEADVDQLALGVAVDDGAMQQAGSGVSQSWSRRPLGESWTQFSLPVASLGNVGAHRELAFAAC
jgi:hypothetical protein